MSLISSAELAASVLDSKEPGCEPSRSVRLSHTQEKSSKSTGPASPAMTTCEPSPLSALEQTELFPMSSVVASPARTSAPPDLGQELMARAAAYGRNTPALLTKFDRATSSWKTSQLSLVADLEEFSETWPRSGMMRNGIAYQLPPLAHFTDATASGFWQTPVADDAVDREVGKFNSRGEPNLSAQVKLLPTPTVMYTRENWSPEELAAKRAEVKAATEAKGKHHTGNGFGLNLAQVARLLPTPTVNGNYNRKGASKTSGDGLATALRLWPTPNAGDYKAGMSNAPDRQQSSLPRSVGIAEGVSSGRRGGLNPTWVEWLMGFPLLWSALEVSEMPSSPRSRKSSGKL